MQWMDVIINTAYGRDVSDLSYQCLSKTEITEHVESWPQAEVRMLRQIELHS